MLPMNVSQKEVDRVARALIESAGGVPPPHKKKRGFPQPPPPDGFAARLRQARRSKNIKQAKMARLVGFTESYYQSIEAGRRPPSLNFQAAVYAWALAQGLERRFDSADQQDTTETRTNVSLPAPAVAAQGERKMRAAAGVPELLDRCAALRRRSAAMHDRFREQSMRLGEALRLFDELLGTSRLLARLPLGTRRYHAPLTGNERCDGE